LPARRQLVRSFDFRKEQIVGIRETLNRNQVATSAITAGIIVLALIFIFRSSCSGGPSIPTQAYYTDDDGATYFTDKVGILPPFQHNGKEAVLANVFKCGSGKPFVAFMTKYTPEAQKAIKDYAATPDKDKMRMPPPEMARMAGTLYKKPKEGAWLGQRDMMAQQQVMSVKCPDGTMAELQWPGK
jgi:hypothetical protein